MNRVEFEVVAVVGPAVGDPDPNSFKSLPQVMISVDGTPLEELVRPVELPFAEADGQEDLAGSYQALSDLRVCWPSRHFLGEPLLSEFEDGDTVLMGCTCGDSGCWPLSVDIEVGDDKVAWSHFRNVHRSNWSLGALGPFVFERAQYEAALRRTERT